MKIDIDKMLRGADNFLHTAKHGAIEGYDADALIVEYIAEAMQSIEQARLLYAEMTVQAREAVIIN